MYRRLMQLLKSILFFANNLLYVFSVALFVLKLDCNNFWFINYIFYLYTNLQIDYLSISPESFIPKDISVRYKEHTISISDINIKSKQINIDEINIVNSTTSSPDLLASLKSIISKSYSSSIQKISTKLVKFVPLVIKLLRSNAVHVNTVSMPQYKIIHLKLSPKESTTVISFIANESIRSFKLLCLHNELDIELDNGIINIFKNHKDLFCSFNFQSVFAYLTIDSSSLLSCTILNKDNNHFISIEKAQHNSFFSTESSIEELHQLKIKYLETIIPPDEDAHSDPTSRKAPDHLLTLICQDKIIACALFGKVSAIAHFIIDQPISEIINANYTMIISSQRIDFIASASSIGCRLKSSGIYINNYLHTNSIINWQDYSAIFSIRARASLRSLKALILCDLMKDNNKLSIKAISTVNHSFSIQSLICNLSANITINNLQNIHGKVKFKNRSLILQCNNLSDLRISAISIGKNLLLMTGHSRNLSSGTSINYSQSLEEAKLLSLVNCGSQYCFLGKIYRSNKDIVTTTSIHLQKHQVGTAIVLFSDVMALNLNLNIDSNLDSIISGKTTIDLISDYELVYGTVSLFNQLNIANTTIKVDHSSRFNGTNIHSDSYIVIDKFSFVNGQYGIVSSSLSEPREAMIFCKIVERIKVYKADLIAAQFISKNHNKYEFAAANHGSLLDHSKPKLSSDFEEVFISPRPVKRKSRSLREMISTWKYSRISGTLYSHLDLKSIIHRIDKKIAVASGAISGTLSISGNLSDIKLHGFLESDNRVAIDIPSLCIRLDQGIASLWVRGNYCVFSISFSGGNGTGSLYSIGKISLPLNISGMARFENINLVNQSELQIYASGNSLFFANKERLITYSVMESDKVKYFKKQEDKGIEIEIIDKNSSITKKRKQNNPYRTVNITDVVIDELTVDSNISKSFWQGKVTINLTNGVETSNGILALTSGNITLGKVTVPIREGKILINNSKLSFTLHAQTRLFDFDLMINGNSDKYDPITISSKPAMSLIDILSYALMSKPFDKLDELCKIQVLIFADYLKGGRLNFLQETMNKLLKNSILESSIFWYSAKSINIEIKFNKSSLLGPLSIGALIPITRNSSFSPSNGDQMVEIVLQSNLGKRANIIVSTKSIKLTLNLI